jgi:hypothetical protein
LPGCSLPLVVVDDVLDEGELLPPQPAIAKLAARTARSVSMAVSGVLFMAGRAPFVALRRQP